ncbi:MAG TPA: efflux RND transporter periplasmic adaptor subunit [Burkholderiaceae bacterium]
MFLTKNIPLVVTAGVVFTLAGCSKPVEKTPDVRPVRVMQAAADNVGLQAEYAGEVRARVESRLGFRVGGKIVARRVEVGSTVKRGQVLMQLDPQDLKLAAAQAGASLRAQETTRDLALAEVKRYRELKAKNFVSQAILDGKESAYKAAQASVDAARAGLSGQSNQAGYATLVADVDGVVTGVDAEVGQVVAPGTPVVRVAKAGGKDVVIGLPEDKVDALRKIASVDVRLWARPDQPIAGKLRELSPIADPATRTYTAKIAIPDTADARLGMTATVRFASTTPNALIKVPLSALYHEKNATAVWVVENGAVKLAPVQTGGVSGNEVVLAGGITPGQTVVTAGVHLLKPGQKVKILGQETAAAAASAPTAGAK